MAIRIIIFMLLFLDILFDAKLLSKHTYQIKISYLDIEKNGGLGDDLWLLGLLFRVCLKALSTELNKM